jgi:hypothetical protein
MSRPSDMIQGIVRTNKNGSDVEFDICTREEWEKMSEDEQNKALVEAANDSGMYEIFVKE